MGPRRLDPEMIAKVCDIVERNFSKMFDRFEARLADQTKKVVSQSDDQSKERIRKAFQRCFLSWGLPIRKRVVWPVKRLVHERKGHGKVEMEVGFFDQ